MARKRYIFFRVLQPLLTKTWLQRCLLGLMTAIFCAVSSPMGLSVTARQVAGDKLNLLALKGSVLESNQSLLQQSKTFYDAGQYAQAIVQLKQAIAKFTSQGDVLNQALALGNLSLAYQQLSKWEEATQATAASLKLLQDPALNQRQQVIAQVLDIQGRWQFNTGQSQQALDSWQQSGVIYQQLGEVTGALKSRINSVQALQDLGLVTRALNVLTEINETLSSAPDSLTKAVGLRSFGDVLQLVGDLERSQQVLEQSLAIAQNLQSPQNISAALFSLGNTARAQQETQTALKFYQQAASTATPTIKLQAQLNQLSLLIDTQQFAEAQKLLPQIEAQIGQLPGGRTAIYAQINFAQSLKRLKDVPNPPQVVAVAQLLATAVKQAHSLQDPRIEAYAIGSLGELYEQNQQVTAAKKLTEQALLLSQSVNAPDISYRLQWQLGRLLKTEGNSPDAIASYTEAVKSLQSLRRDLVATNPNVEFSFRSSVEPVYRQLVSLLLESAQPSAESNVIATEKAQKNLVQARNIFESLQAAELVNFFRSECFTATPVQIDQLDLQAAVIYPVILADRLEVILSLPKQPLRHYTTQLKDSKVEDVLSQLRQLLVKRTSKEFLPLSQQVYNWLIRPAEADLSKNKVKTLVFVLDGSLRNIPMAALHDGKQYLLEKYSLALTPGLQLLPPDSFQKKQLKVLTAGLTEARQSFPALANVGVELQQIQDQLPTVELLNQQFTSIGLQTELKSVPFPVVHIASHGQFSSKPEDTFILTWDSRININQLDNLLRSSDRSRVIELLVLSACRTVAGDKRAALGLAGVAIRAGARSTLASLWYINDAATVPFMSRFYKELATTTVTRAEALRRAQLILLQNPKYRHPVYWAAYVLVGNWL
jgi:CHAT domain-containing protein